MEGGMEGNRKRREGKKKKEKQERTAYLPLEAVCVYMNV